MGLTVIYVDRVFLLNTLVDYLLLLSSARLAGTILRRRRFLLCATGGGIYAAAVFWIPWLANPIGKILSGVLLAWIAYRKEARPLRLMALFFLLCGGLAGILLGLGYASGSPTAYLDRLQSAQISWQMLILSAILFSVLLNLLFRQGARHGGEELMSMMISISGQQKTIRALHDTGNTLRDPISGRPVLVLEQEAIRDLVPAEIWKIIAGKEAPEEKMAEIHRMTEDYRFTLLPFRSVGVPSGLILAIWSDFIEIDTRRYGKTLIALSPGPVADGGGYQALWGAEERGKKDEAASNHTKIIREDRRAG